MDRKQIAEELNTMGSNWSEELYIEDEKELLDEIKEKLISKLDTTNNISAPEIGIKKRVICLKLDSGDIKLFINPMILETKDINFVSSQFDNVKYLVPRFKSIVIGYQTEDGKCHSIKLINELSYIIQHHIDIFNGVNEKDFGLEIIDGFEEASEEEQQQILNMHLEFLKEKSNYLNNIIKDDPTLNEFNKGVEYMTKLRTGQIDTELTYALKQDLKKGKKKKKRKH